MRILIDECLDWRLCESLTGHDCTSVRRMGWSGLTNGALLRKAETEFDVFITGDRNLSFQQTASDFDIAVIVLHAESIQLSHTRPLMPKVSGILRTLQSGQVVDIYP
jgi:predicted nuclease of predicted toxin-antitoxin system